MLENGSCQIVMINCSQLALQLLPRRSKIVMVTCLVSICGLLYAQVTELPPIKESKPKGSVARQPKTLATGPTTTRSTQESPPPNERANSPAKPDLSRASPSEQSMIEKACNYDRLTKGPAVYYKCLSSQMSQLTAVDRKPDLSRASPSEQSMIEKACNYDRLTKGPAIYYKCQSSQMSHLAALDRRPDLSRASPSEQSMIEKACNYDRLTKGPAIYYKCQSSQMSHLAALDRRPDLSRASPSERSMIEKACNYQRLTKGPAIYYKCLQGQLAQLGF